MARRGKGQLTPKEAEVLEGLSYGLSYKQIARRLGKERTTIQRQVHMLLKKLQVPNKMLAVVKMLAPERLANPPERWK